MRRIVTLGFASLFALAACGKGGGSTAVDGGIDGSVLENPGFPLPTAATKANMEIGGVWTEVGDADWSCLQTPSSDLPATQIIALAGTVVDFQSGVGVGNATVTAFPGTTLTANNGMATSSDVAATRGDYAMSLSMLPSGQTRFGFEVEAAGYVRTFAFNQYLDPTVASQTLAVRAMSESTATAFPTFVDLTRDVSKGMVVGSMLDCQGRQVSNAVATVSSTQGIVTHLTGVKTFYFSADSSSLPVHHSQAPTMAEDGMFLVLDVPPQTTAYIQVWGFLHAAHQVMGAAGLELLAELAVPIEANTVTTSALEPRRQ